MLGIVLDCIATAFNCIGTVLGLHQSYEYIVPRRRIKSTIRELNFCCAKQSEKTQQKSGFLIGLLSVWEPSIYNSGLKYKMNFQQ